ncbi:TPA: hypothetical protein ACH3X2_14260 [Trebouxia sp. C0005]
MLGSTVQHQIMHSMLRSQNIHGADFFKLQSHSPALSQAPVSKPNNVTAVTAAKQTKNTNAQHTTPHHSNILSLRQSAGSHTPYSNRALNQVEQQAPVLSVKMSLVQALQTCYQCHHLPSMVTADK